MTNSSSQKNNNVIIMDKHKKDLLTYLENNKDKIHKGSYPKLVKMLQPGSRTRKNTLQTIDQYTRSVLRSGKKLSWNALKKSRKEFETNMEIINKQQEEGEKAHKKYVKKSVKKLEDLRGRNRSTEMLTCSTCSKETLQRIKRSQGVDENKLLMNAIDNHVQSLAIQNQSLVKSFT